MLEMNTYMKIYNIIHLGYFRVVGLLSEFLSFIFFSVFFKFSIMNKCFF